MGSSYWTSTEQWPSRAEIKAQAPKLECPRCKQKGMNVRWNQGQPFFGCPAYPDCKGSRNWTGSEGFQQEQWEDPLKAKGVIDTETPEPPRGQPTTQDWKQRFIDERAFVMQQLSDVKAAYTQQMQANKRQDEELKTLREQVKELQGKVLGVKEAPEDDMPF